MVFPKYFANSDITMSDKHWIAWLKSEQQCEVMAAAKKRKSQHLANTSPEKDHATKKGARPWEEGRYANP